MSMRILIRGPRLTAAWALGCVIAVSLLWLVFDGGRPAVAAGECEYEYAPYGEPCPKATPDLNTAPQPAQGPIGSSIYDRATLSGGNWSDRND